MSDDRIDIARSCAGATGTTTGSFTRSGTASPSSRSCAARPKRRAWRPGPGSPPPWRPGCAGSWMTRSRWPKRRSRSRPTRLRLDRPGQRPAEPETPRRGRSGLPAGDRARPRVRPPVDQPGEPPAAPRALRRSAGGLHPGRRSRPRLRASLDQHRHDPAGHGPPRGSARRLRAGDRGRPRVLPPLELPRATSCCWRDDPRRRCGPTTGRSRSNPTTPTPGRAGAGCSRGWGGTARRQRPGRAPKR